MEKTKHNTYLDLSKCTEEELKQVITKIFSSDSPVAALTRYILEEMMVHKFNGTPYLLINKFNHWKLNETDMGKTELTYPEFIKLFEGGEGENEIENIKDIAYTEGVLIGLKICKEMWAQGTISHENIQEEIYHYQEELDNLNSNQ